MKTDMTKGNPMKIILMFSIPVLMGNLFQQFYNMVDTIIVGQYLGSDALAAVGSTGCLMFLVLGFANGIAQGFGVMVSHAFGAKNEKLLKHYVALAIILTVIVAGIFCTMSYNVASGLLRSIGDSKTPLYFLIFSSVLNIILDVFFIVVVKAGTAGAAYATVISQGLAAVLSFIVMFRKYDILRTHRDDYYMDWNGIWHMLPIGIQMALNYSITAIGTMIFQAAVNVFGSQVVAAFTAASKVNNIATQTMPTLGAAAATYCGQNLGAGKYDRIFKGMRSCFWICIGCAVLAAAINCFVGPHMIGWFITSPTAADMDYAMRYLRIASIFMLPLAWIFAYRNGLQGLNRGLVPMLSGVMELAARVIAIAILAKPFGYTGVCYADPAAWLSTGVLLIVTYLIWELRTKKKIA